MDCTTSFWYSSLRTVTAFLWLLFQQNETSAWWSGPSLMRTAHLCCVIRPCACPFWSGYKEGDLWADCMISNQKLQVRPYPNFPHETISGTLCHCTLEMLQLSTLSSLLWKPISSTSTNLTSSYLPDLLRVSVCVACKVYVCVCVWMQGERGGRESMQQMWLCVTVLMYNYVVWEKYLCNYFVTPSPLFLHDLVKRLELVRIGVWK